MDWVAHVFGTIHRRIQVKVLYVGDHEGGAGCIDNAVVEKHLDGGQVGGGCAFNARVDDEVAANCEADAFALGLVCFGTNDDTERGGLVAYG